MTHKDAEALLWPDGPITPPFRPDGAAPTLEFFAPTQPSTGAAVVVCPGGGYGMHAPHEAMPVVEWLGTLGITSALLHYRLAPHARHPEMLEDAQRAIRTVRVHAKELDIDPAKVGILGFSAGGHLAATAATLFDRGDATASDPVQRLDSRPDLAILIYPVITFDSPHVHAGSRTNLMGDAPDADLIRLLSAEQQVTATTPPMFLVHGSGDTVVPAEHSLLLAGALGRAGVAYEVHIYEGGEHGFGLGPTSPNVAPWTERCAEWLRLRGFAM